MVEHLACRTVLLCVLLVLEVAAVLLRLLLLMVTSILPALLPCLRLCPNIPLQPAQSLLITSISVSKPWC
jgi:hypothetical protein